MRRRLQPSLFHLFDAALQPTADPSFVLADETPRSRKHIRLQQFVRDPFVRTAQIHRVAAGSGGDTGDGRRAAHHLVFAFAFDVGRNDTLALRQAPIEAVAATGDLDEKAGLFRFVADVILDDVQKRPDA